MLGRVSSLDFFVSLSFMPLSMAAAGPLSKVVPVQAIFTAAGVVPLVLAAVALAAARMPRDEIAHPLH
jgi:DHA3 family tetracycline resistance protein-like MFS transporter